MIADDPKQWIVDGPQSTPAKETPKRQFERNSPGFETWVRETSNGNIDAETKRLRQAERL